MALVSFRIGAFLALAGLSYAQNIVVDAAQSHAVNSFSPMRALGGAIDRFQFREQLVGTVEHGRYLGGRAGRRL